MSLDRGIQSAIFYYLSCAPCTGYSYRKKRRKEANRDLAHKKQLDMDQPGLYRHPGPFATNPHWQTEIDLGPAPPAARRKRENQKKTTRTRTSGGNESNVASSVSLSLAHRDTNDSTWNLRRHQREDEDLWGPNLAPRISRASGLEGSIINGKGTLSRPATARTAATDRSHTTYHSINNPPINDFHPPIVTRIDTKEDAMWMLQPPPAARIMSGVDRPSHTQSRARTNSGSSKMSSRRGDAAALSRHVSHRIIDEKLRAGELLPPVFLPREEPRRAFDRPSAQAEHDQSTLLTSSAEDLSSDDVVRSRRRRRPPPINVSEDSNASHRTVLHRSAANPVPIDDSNSAGKLNPRQDLSPMHCENAPSWRNARNHSTSPSRESNQRVITADRDRQENSLHVLQELAPCSLLNVRNTAKAPRLEARVELPASDNFEEMELLGSGKAAFENFYEARDFELSKWISERTRRDVSSRWSVDF